MPLLQNTTGAPQPYIVILLIEAFKKFHMTYIPTIDISNAIGPAGFTSCLRSISQK